jgi:hypothetical protein
MAGRGRIEQNCDSLDGDAAVEVVALDVALDPVLGGAGAAGEVGEQLVGDGGHDLDAAGGERAHAGELGVEELHLLDAVVLEQLHHHVGRHRVPRLRAPVHPQRLRPRHRPARHRQHQRDGEPRPCHRSDQESVRLWLERE